METPDTKTAQEEGPEALKNLPGQLASLEKAFENYASVHVENIKFSVRKFVFGIFLTFLLLIFLCGVLLLGIAFIFHGIALGLSALFAGNILIGYLIAGIFLVGVIITLISITLKKIKKPTPDTKQARKQLDQTFVDLKQSIKGSTNLRSWVRRYPWQSTGVAAVSGFVIAEAAIPSQEKKKTQENEGDTKTSAETVDESSVQAILIRLVTEILKGVVGPLIADWLHDRGQAKSKEETASPTASTHSDDLTKSRS